MHHAAISGNLVLLGWGSIARGVLPLIRKHIQISPERIIVVAPDYAKHDLDSSSQTGGFVRLITRDNYREYLHQIIGSGDVLLNLSVDVSSVALIEFCQDVGALYLDCCIEPWEGGYTDPSLTPSQLSNHALREAALSLRMRYPEGPTALVAHGANPGLVSSLLKEALIRISQDIGCATTLPHSQRDWVNLARSLGVKAIHIAERDTQAGSYPRRLDEFVNTWSIDGFTNEARQPAEIGWGTHEKNFPSDAHRHPSGSDAGIYLLRPGGATKVRTWTPSGGPVHAFLITHNESIAIADYYTIKEEGQVAYRPTVSYAYRPCDDAVISLDQMAAKNWRSLANQRLLMAEISSGFDELGVLIMGHNLGAYWFGSRLSIEEARCLAPCNNATTLQVAAGVLAGLVWILENPRAGLVEPDQVDSTRILQIARPYLGELAGHYTDWSPLLDRGRLFPEDVDRYCPWQFVNFRVA